MGAEMTGKQITPDNGWAESQQLVQHKLTDLADGLARLTNVVEGLRDDFNARHVPPCSQVVEVALRVGKLQPGISLIKWLFGLVVVGMAAFILNHLVQGG